MIRVKMVEKYKDKYGRIIGYCLVDKNGIKKDMKSSELKLAIREGQIQVINLTLTSDNRLMQSSMISRVQKSQKPKNKANKKVGIFKEKAKETYTIGYSIIHKINSVVPKKLNWYFVTPFDEKYKTLKLEKVDDITDSVKISYEGDSDLAIIVNASKLYLGNTKEIPANLIEDYYFYGVFERCGMSSLDLHNIDISKVTNMSSLFYDCNSLQRIDLSSFDTSKVRNMCKMFENCKSLQSIDLSSFNILNVNMGCMFAGCESLQSLDLSSFNTSNVRNMYCMFAYCYSLQNLDLSSFDTSNVTTMYGMFLNCKSLKHLDLSSFNTSKVIDMCEMFTDCHSLQSINLSNFDISNLKNTDDMFSRCTSLEKIYVNSKNIKTIKDITEYDELDEYILEKIK